MVTTSHPVKSLELKYDGSDRALAKLRVGSTAMKDIRRWATITALSVRGYVMMMMDNRAME
jgi:hypothetical protein